LKTDTIILTIVSINPVQTELRELMALFKDRVDAGKKLARELSKYANRSDVLILALPRGGVPVAFEVAKELDVEMDIFIVRKLGVPGDHC
jgi:predicted phosphoribosyltransferase